MGMTEYKRAFYDTAIFIYYLDKSDIFFEKTKELFANSLRKGVEIVTSTITYEEYCVLPYRIGDKTRITNFNRFMNILKIKIFDISIDIANMAAVLRAKYPGIKSMDALQLATAIVSECDVFYTNDKQLLQVEEVNVVVL